MITADCSALIAANSGWHPLYGDRLSNHLPMALIALDTMGASVSRLQQFAAHYSQRLVKRGAPMAALDPMTCIGNRADFEGVCSYFVARIAQIGADSVLRSWVPQLIPGLSASAFHALIRLAYGIDASEPSEIAIGLACWTVEYQTLGSITERTANTLLQIAQTTSATVTGHHFRPGIIIDRMTEIATHLAVHRACMQPDSIDYLDVSQFAIGMYAAREDFTLLHLFTACHAFASIAMYAGDVTRATRYLWQAVLMAYLTTGHPCEPILTASHDPRYGWHDCLQRAVASQDDHVIKLTYSAWREFARTQDPLYLQIAWRKTSDGADRPPTHLPPGA